MNRFDDIDMAMSREQVAQVLDEPVERVMRAEEVALEKVGIGFVLIELVGRSRGEAILVSLHGAGLSAFRRALADARAHALRGAR